MFTGLQSIFYNFPEITIKFPQYLVIVQAFSNIKKNTSLDFIKICVVTRILSKKGPKCPTVRRRFVSGAAVAG